MHALCMVYECVRVCVHMPDWLSEPVVVTWYALCTLHSPSSVEIMVTKTSGIPYLKYLDSAYQIIMI